MTRSNGLTRSLMLVCVISSTAVLQEAAAQEYGNQRVAENDASVYGRSSAVRVAPNGSNLDRSNLDRSNLDRGNPDQLRVPSEPTKTSSFPRLMVNDSNGESATPLESKNQFAAPLVTVASSLAVVLGLFAALVWVSRKYGSKTMGGAIPGEVIQTLGSTPIDPRTRITMIRLGSRILVVAQTASGITPISEITDPEEVRNLTAHCVGDSKTQFTDTLKAIEQEPVGEGFLGQPSAAPKARNRGSLFTTA